MLATILFLFTEIAVGTYVKSFYSEAEKCAKEDVLITGSISEKILTDAKEHFEQYGICQFATPIYTGSTSYQWESMELSLMPYVIGTDANLFSCGVLSTQFDQPIFCSQVVSGRSLQEEDIRNHQRVVVISQLAEEVLFHGETAIGKTLEISLLADGKNTETFLVVGVYQNSIDEEAVLQTLRTARKKGVSSVNLPLNFYIPITVVQEISSVFEEINAMVIGTGTDLESKATVHQYYSQLDSVAVNDYETKVSNLDSLYQEVKTAVWVLEGMMLLIAGLNLFNSMMFSIRERIGEIGIRKAMGAGNADILRQFVLEGIFVTLLGGLAAVLLVSLTAFFLQVIMHHFLTWEISIVLTPIMLIKALCYMILMGIGFGLFTSLVAARVKIFDAIRFD